MRNWENPKTNFSDRAVIQRILNRSVSLINCSELLRIQTSGGWKEEDLEVGIKGKVVLSDLRGHNTHLLIFAHSLLKEVRLPFKGDAFHEVKRILRTPDLQEIELLSL